MRQFVKKGSKKMFYQMCNKNIESNHMVIYMVIVTYMVYDINSNDIIWFE